jgi:hypothetical protein
MIECKGAKKIESAVTGRGVAFDAQFWGEHSNEQAFALQISYGAADQLFWAAAYAC